MWTTSLRPISGRGILIDDLAGASLHHEAPNAQAFDANSGFTCATTRGLREPVRRIDGLWCGSPPSYGFIRAPKATVAPSDCARVTCRLNDWLEVSEMDRRSMMLMTGIAAVAAAIPLPEARAFPSPDAPPADRVPLPTEPPPGATAGNYISRTSSMARSVQAPIRRSGRCRARRTTSSRRSWAIPRRSPKRIPRRQLQSRPPRHARIGQYFGGKLRGNWRSLIGQTWEARIKLDCLNPGVWPAFWAVHEDPLPDGEVDIFEWYGNGSWPAGTTVHAASNGKTWEGRSIPELVDGGWHNWRMRWDQDGFKFWRDYVDGAEPYFSVPPKPIQVSGRPDDLRWPFNIPGYWLNPMFTLAVGGPGAGDPALGNFPAAMLIDWIRVW